MRRRVPEEGPGAAGEGAVAQRLSELTPHPRYHGRHPIHEHHNEPQSDGPSPQPIGSPYGSSSWFPFVRPSGILMVRPTIQNQTRHEALRCRVSVLVRNTHSTELERRW